MSKLKPELQEAHYRCWGYGSDPGFPEYNKVAYIIIGDCCYFSGVEKEMRTSTINAAESIIEAISHQENILAIALRWFDLLTYRGYNNKPGEYELKELKIGPSKDLTSKGWRLGLLEVNGEEALIYTEAEQDFVIASWNDVALCPNEVLEIFRDYIGADFYAKSIAVLGLSTHACDRLRSMGIKTIAELISGDVDVYRLPYKEVNEITDALGQYKLHLCDGAINKKR